jgi:hypothetical protein
VAVAEQRIPINLPEPGPAAAGVARFGLPLLSVGLFGALAISVLTNRPLIAVAIPAVALGAIACVRRPTAAVVGVLLLSGMVNTIEAFTPIPTRPMADYLLFGLWAGVAGIYLSGTARRTFWLWPALVALIAYLMLTLVEVFLVEPVGDGFDAFRAAAWYMAAVVLLAVAPLSRETHVRIAKGIVGVAFVVGAYIVFRKIVGPSDRETLAAFFAQPERVRQQRFFGSFLSPFQLAQWTATMIPFLVAVALTYRGRWRLLAVIAIGFMGTGLLASDVRTGLVAMVVGLLVVLAVYLASPAFPGRLGIGLAGLLAILIAGTVGYALTIGASDQRSERYARLLDPTNDKAFTDRLETWDAALEEMAEEPWGHGLGTAGGAAQKLEAGIEFGSLVSPHLDSAYIKVGLEQGFAVMLLFAAAMLALLVGMAIRATRIRDRDQATLLVGGTGVLASLSVMFYAGLYSEGLPVVAAWVMIGLGVAQATIRTPAERPRTSGRVAV